MTSSSSGAKLGNEIVTWKTTDGDFNLQQFNGDASSGWGELGYGKWQLVKFAKENEEHAKQRDPIQSQIDGKL